MKRLEKNPNDSQRDLKGQAEGKHRKYQVVENHGKQRKGRFEMAVERQSL